MGIRGHGRDALFDLDRDGSGADSYLQYCHDALATKPDPVFDFSFLLFDREKQIPPVIGQSGVRETVGIRR